MSKDFEKEINDQDEIKNIEEQISPEEISAENVDNEAVVEAEELSAETTQDAEIQEQIPTTEETSSTEEEGATTTAEEPVEEMPAEEISEELPEPTEDITEEPTGEITDESTEELPDEIPEIMPEEIPEELTEEIPEERTEEIPEVPDEDQKGISVVEEAPPVREKKNSFKKFLKKFRLPLIIAAAVIVVAAAITTTVLILNAPKFFIRDATDFMEAPNKRQVVYVLKDDITVDGDLVLNNALDINLNGHTLTIKGEFKRVVSGENVMDIGTIKKKEYNSDGEFLANSVNIAASDSTLNLYCASELSGSISLKQLNLLQTANINQGKRLTLAGTKVVIEKQVSGEMRLTASSSLTLKADASLDNLLADDTSSAVIFGKINSGINGGGDISLLGSASCSSIKNVINLYFQQATATMGIAENVQNLFVVTQLDKPAELNIERSGNVFKAISSRVNNADQYIFTIKAGDEVIATIPSASNECDITEHISQPKTYTISVKASSTTPKTNLPSAELSIEYNYSIKLQSPVLSIIQDDIKTTLSFPKVNFATLYKIFINGTEFSVETPDGDTASIDITNHVKAAGSYNIKVVASYPGNSSFLDSDTVMATHVTTLTLDAPMVVFEKTDKLKVSWQAVPNAKTYVIDFGEGKIVTTGTSLTLDLTSIADNTPFSVQAQSIGYYIGSQSTTVYEYPQLEITSQPTYTFDGANLHVEMDAVSGAESYTLLINNIEVETSANAVFNTTAEAGDSFKIVATAAYTREVISASTTIALS